MKVLSVFLSILVLCWAEDDDKLTAASNNLGLRLFSLLPSSPDKNVFFSPYSLSIAMGMAYAGARGETQQELYDKLGYSGAGLLEAQVLDAYARQTQRLRSTPSNTTLDVANGAAIHVRLALLEEYENTLRNSFNADLQKVDFVDGRRSAIDIINGWVKEKTQNKIQSLFSEPLDPITRLVLLNAMYFKGKWEVEFNKYRTTKKPFFNGGVTQADVDTMVNKFYIRYKSYDDVDADVAELSYRGGDYSMVIMLPKERTGVEALKQNLTADLLKTLVDGLVRRKFEVLLPRFKFDTQYSLKNNLKSLGIRKMFDADADLSGISGDQSLQVADVVQKAVVEVNEEGTEAAAVSGVIYTPLSRPRPDPQFKVDHPFLFFIRNTQTHAILFAGQVNKI